MRRIALAMLVAGGFGLIGASGASTAPANGAGIAELGRETDQVIQVRESCGLGRHVWLDMRRAGLAFFEASFDLKSVNFSVTGSNCATPSAEAQILPLPSTSMVTAPPSGDIGGGRLVDSNLLGLGFELAEAATAGIDIEPEVAIGVAGDAVGDAVGVRGGYAVAAVDLEVFDLSSLAIDLADRDDLIDGVDGV
jgi:hypothetical protein